MQDGTTTLEDILEVSYKTILLITQSSNHTHWCLLKVIENFCPQKSAHRCLLLIVKTWMQPRYTSVGKWIHKLWLIQTTGSWGITSVMSSSLQPFELFMGFSKQEYWSGLHALLPGIFLTQGSNLGSIVTPALLGGFFTTNATWEAHPKNMKTLIWKYMWTHMFITALFTRAKTWKQPKCSSVDDWIKKMWRQHGWTLRIFC